MERTLRCLGPTSLFHRWRNYSLETTDPCYRDSANGKARIFLWFPWEPLHCTFTLHHQLLYFMLCWVIGHSVGIKGEKGADRIIFRNRSTFVSGWAQGWLQTLLFQDFLRFTHCHSKVLGKFAVNISKETVNQLTDFIFLHQSKSSAT